MMNILTYLPYRPSLNNRIINQNMLLMDKRLWIKYSKKSLITPASHAISIGNKKSYNSYKLVFLDINMPIKDGI